jgi:hypothetical protein
MTKVVIPSEREIAMKGLGALAALNEVLVGGGGRLRDGAKKGP